MPDKTKKITGGDRPPSPVRRIHLRNPHDVRRLLSCTINNLRRGEINPVIAGKIIYGAQALLTCLEVCDMEERMKRLEQEIKRRGL
jgi:hypothetical protein